MKQSQLNQLQVLTFPLILAIGIFLIPVVTDYSDHELASQAVQMTGRWFAFVILTPMNIGHVVFILGSFVYLIGLLDDAWVSILERVHSAVGGYHSEVKIA